MQHSTYWSNTKFADWVRGTKKPFALTSTGWKDWKNDAKVAHPVRYWLAEDFLGALQDTLCWPAGKYRDVKHYINNRWVTKTHAMTSTLKRGKWYDFDTRLLNCMFDELVNFVEVESAWHHILWSDEARAKYKTPWYVVSMIRFWREWRCPAAGLDHLAWQIKLVLDEGSGVQPGQPEYGQPTAQAVTAQETLDLYNWWKHDRPARRDVYEVSGWNEITKDDCLFDDTPSLAKTLARDKSLEIMATLEKRYEREDEEMMIRLIKLRKSLWTERRNLWT